MTIINRTALVPYSPIQMYTIVKEVDQYPNFLPWCGDAKTLSVDGNTTTASITIAKGPVNKTFTTSNILVEGESLEMQLINGPFKSLNGLWTFQDIKGQACKISFDLDFQFSSRLVELTIGPIFNQIANSLIDAFIEEAKKQYG
ncbi:MAG: type II toxin-antitoxin system RatA family toxin [Thiotrichaceae bacterium]|nr:type II toxin-antitoxin system RatA family toxin [Thiotrichaceae bacterium]